MLTQDRTQAIESLFKESDLAFAAGDDKRGSQKLWDAAECALSIVAASRSRPGQTEDDHFDILESLMAEKDRKGDGYDGYDLISGYLVAGSFQNNADYGFMEGYELEGSRRSVRHFVNELLPFAE